MDLVVASDRMNVRQLLDAIEKEEKRYLQLRQQLTVLQSQGRMSWEAYTFMTEVGQKRWYKKWLELRDSVVARSRRYSLTSDSLHNMARKDTWRQIWEGFYELNTDCETYRKIADENLPEKFQVGPHPCEYICESCALDVACPYRR